MTPLHHRHTRIPAMHPRLWLALCAVFWGMVLWLWGVL